MVGKTSHDQWITDRDTDADEAGGSGEAGGRELPGSSRRKFMVASAISWASVSLAGCTGTQEGDDDEGGDEEEPIPTFVVTDEIIVGSEGIPEGAEGLIRPGVAQRTFVPGMEVVFKVGVWDRESDAIVSDQALDEVRVDLDRDESIELSFYRDDREWSGDWAIPEDAEPGTVEYTVEVVNGAEFNHVGVLESEFEIVEFDGFGGDVNYVATINTYSTTEAGNGFVQSCLPQHNYAPGMKVGFEIGVYDGGTGEAIGDENAEEVVVVMDNGDEIPLEYHEMDHEGENPEELWRGTWEIPEDQEPGTLPFEVQISADKDVHQVGGHRSRHGISQDSIEVIDPNASDEEEEENGGDS